MSLGAGTVSILATDRLRLVEPVLREQDVREIDEDGREEPAVADLDRDPLGVADGALRRLRIAREHLGLGREQLHPHRDRAQAELREVGARQRHLVAGVVELPAHHRLEHRAEAGQLDDTLVSELALQLQARLERLRSRRRAGDERPAHVLEPGGDLEAAACALRRLDHALRVPVALLDPAVHPGELAQQVRHTRDARGRRRPRGTPRAACSATAMEASTSTSSGRR